MREALPTLVTLLHHRLSVLPPYLLPSPRTHSLLPEVDHAVEHCGQQGVEALPGTLHQAVAEHTGSLVSHGLGQPEGERVRNVWARRCLSLFST